jgi:hypothetical protein
MDGPRLIAPILVVALGAGACAAHRPATPSIAMETALAQARDSGRVPLEERLGAGLRGPGTFGTGQPAVPVVVPPDIRRVWVPTHENQDGELVAGHWVFLRVRDFRWFLEPPPRHGTGSAASPLGLPAAPSIPGAGAKAGSGVPWVEVPAGSPTGVPRPAGASGATAPPPRSAGGTSPAPGR